MVKVVFVCLGNICRSTMAEAVLRHKVAQEGLSDRIRVDSAGTSRYHIGEPPHPGTCEKLRENEISYEGIKARQLTKQDFQEADYIVVMDEGNASDSRAFSTKENIHKLHLLADFVPDGCFAHGRNVPDPWFTGDFQQTYELASQGCQGLLEEIKSTMNL